MKDEIEAVTVYRDRDGTDHFTAHKAQNANRRSRLVEVFHGLVSYCEGRDAADTIITAIETDPNVQEAVKAFLGTIPARTGKRQP